MLNNFSKNKLLIFAAIILLSALLTASINSFSFPRLDAVFNDFQIGLFKRKNPSPNIKLIHLTPVVDDTLYFSTFDLSTHKQIIQTLLDSEAKAIFYAIDPQQFLTKGAEVELEAFIQFTKSHKNLYFILPSTFNNIRTATLNHPQLSKLNIIQNLEGTDMISGANDWVNRRLVLWNNEITFPFKEIFNYEPLTLDGKFLRNDHYCIKTRFSKKGSYSSIYVKNDSGIEFINKDFAMNNWVFVSLNAKFDLFDYRKVPYDHSPYAMNYNEALANNFDTVLQKDHPKVFSQFSNSIWIFLNLVIFLLLVYFAQTKKLFVFSFVQLLSVILIPIIFFGLTTWQLDTTKPFLSLFLLQYLTIPLILIKLIRQNDRNLNLAKEEKEKAINKAKITAKSAKADLGFKIATQIAHDVKSPVMALETVKMLTRAEIKPEIQKLLENAITRINNIADSLLHRFRSGTLEASNEITDTNIISALKMIIDVYKQTHPNVSVVLNSKAHEIFIPIDQTEFERSITNILNNSIEAMNFKGSITFTIDDHHDFAQILIEDSGKGIPPEIQSKIFDTGFTHDKKAGSGIGLAQAKEAFIKIGGKLELASSVPGKTVFKVTMAKTNLRSLEIQASKNIVIIEDSEEVRNTWIKILEKQNRTYRCFNSFKNFKDEMENKSFNLFQNQKYTLISDLIFDNEDETGFDAIQLAKDRSPRLLSNAFLCTTLSTNQEIGRIASDLRIQIFGKSDLNKIQLIQA